jgi:GTPase SAR1 family protein
MHNSFFRFLSLSLSLACFQESFQTLKNWVKELQTLGPENIVIALAGNKVDLADKREVAVAAAEQYAKDINAIHIETSAKHDTNVHGLFEQISEHNFSPFFL